ncbi:MAG: DUF6883 domain-containing protein [Limisphaerales bacterium]
MPNWRQCRKGKSHIICSTPRIRLAAAKHGFFLRFGFTVAEWQKLADALLHHARENEILETEQTSHGWRYVVDGKLISPDGTSLNIRSAWYIDAVGGAPRFVTAHPLPKL